MASIDELRAELIAALGDDLADAATTVASWAVTEDPHRWPPLAPTGLVRRGLVEGRSYELEWLMADVELMERAAAALRQLVDHVTATHPRARQRARAAARRAAGTTF